MFIAVTDCARASILSQMTALVRLSTRVLQNLFTITADTDGENFISAHVSPGCSTAWGLNPLVSSPWFEHRGALLPLPSIALTLDSIKLLTRSASEYESITSVMTVFYPSTRPCRTKTVPRNTRRVHHLLVVSLFVQDV